ncbi:4-phosphoerythronate dehydrogenase [Microbulbifer discodermiae]|uniref:4-phosphoerythronate dehydrogenase n=1 Tax=Microbulbifer sp. 2201CG32-9 TaxID=3232309 RepID=UPI00345B6E66
MTRSAPQLNIVADENIPALEHYFGGLGSIQRLPGRPLCRAQLARADVLLVRSVTRVDEQLLQGTPVKFVGSCTIGTDHLDTDWLERNGIAWSAAPGANANSVVEYVFCALAALGCDWRERRFGIVGCGNVGGLLQRRLHRLGVQCAVYDPWLPDNPDSAPLERVLRQDVVCLHAPLVTGGPHPSRHLLGERQLASLPDGAVLISAGRGAVVDNSALLGFLRGGGRVTTVLDVWEGEPAINTALLELVDIGTPHIAGYSLDGKLAGTRMIRAAVGLALLGEGNSGQATSEEGQAHTIAVGPGAEKGGFGQLADLLLQIYDPRSDDTRLRQAARGALPMAQAFDLLRREYPQRHEFHHYCIDDARLDKAQRAQLAALGLYEAE